MAVQGMPHGMAWQGVERSGWVATTWVMPLTITLSTQLNVQQPFNVQHSPATLVNGQWVFRSLGLPSSIFQSLSSHFPPPPASRSLAFGILLWSALVIEQVRHVPHLIAPLVTVNLRPGQATQPTLPLQHTHTHLTH